MNKNVEERQTVQEFNDPLSQDASTRVVSRSTQVSSPDKNVNILGLSGFIVAILALFFYDVYAIPGIVAVIFSSLAMSQVAYDGSPGHGFAVWGVLLSGLRIIWVVMQYFGFVPAEGMLLNYLRNAFQFTS